MGQPKAASCVERIPDVTYVRVELARNQRERSLLQKLLKLSERKAALVKLNAESEGKVSHA